MKPLPLYLPVFIPTLGFRKNVTVGFESPPSTKPPFSTRRLDPPIFLKLTIESDDIGPFFLICEVYP